MQGLKQGVAIVIVLVLAACSAMAAPLLPADPPGTIRPAEYSFGDAVQSRDWRATRQVLDQLEARFGVKSMRILIRNLPADADPAAIRAHYAAALPGWQALELDRDNWKQSWSFALVSPDGGKVLAVVALRPDEVVNSGMVPMNILTNLEETP